MDELEKARQARDKAFDSFMRYATLETKNSLNARKWRNEHRIHADEVRALERDIYQAQSTRCMRKVIREVDEQRGILQVTIADERWYVKEEKDPATDLPVLRYVPSVTWICGHYPKGIGFYKWLAEHGWDESQAIKQAAGDKGSKVHDAISAILRGEEVRIDSEFLNRSNDKMEELALEEVDGIKSFVDWKAANNPTHIAWDLTVFSEKFGYAGTIDYICKVGDEIILVDFKTSAQVWPEYELQVSAYKQALVEMQGRGDFSQIGDMSQVKLAILQVGYSKNKAGYKWNDVEDQFPLFMAARQIWAKECEGQQPKKRDYPIVLSPAITVDEALAADPTPPATTKKAKTK